MQYWWVFQAQHGQAEAAQPYLWAPMGHPTGRILSSWLNVGKVRKGDLIFGYCQMQIVAVYRATANAVERKRPRQHAGPGIDRGFMVAIEPLDPDLGDISVPVTDIPASIRPLLQGSGYPLNKHGTGKKGYLYEVSNQAGDRLLEHVRLHANHLSSRSDDAIWSNGILDGLPEDAALRCVQLRLQCPFCNADIASWQTICQHVLHIKIDDEVYRTSPMAAQLVHAIAKNLHEQHECIDSVEYDLNVGMQGYSQDELWRHCNEYNALQEMHLEDFVDHALKGIIGEGGIVEKFDVQIGEHEQNAVAEVEVLFVDDGDLLLIQEHCHEENS